MDLLIIDGTGQVPFSEKGAQIFFPVAVTCPKNHFLTAAAKVAA